MVEVVRVLNVEASYEGQNKVVQLHTIKGDGPSLLGRDWLQMIKLNWAQINLVPSLSPALDKLQDKHAALFQEGLGLLKDATVKLHVCPDCVPKFHKPHPVPFALREGVEKKLERLQRLGVIKPVATSDWAAPIVPVVKRDHSVRVCGDYKLTINQASNTETYPLPRIEEIFASLSGSKTFTKTKLDLQNAYQQLLLEEKSQELITINIHRGLFQYTRLPFGIASAPAIFQRAMETVLQGLPGVCVYLDDILVTGASEKEHLEHLKLVLQRLEDVGLRLKRSKCQFMVSHVEYLGHCIDQEGLHPTAGKVEAIQKAPAPAPANKTQLKAFFGLVNYYCKFLPHLSSRLSPLYFCSGRTVSGVRLKRKRMHFKLLSQDCLQICC